ncbi:hypothetical protein [Kosakonia sp. S42]|uniref:hypothetical protein n=1 Tax=Kosakonia sp. S42 TaxID=2767458 RepID=UPI0019095500|nr:hypothetical protein [Kosakonia sp. S42]MBK0019293.1 hypothetical protein [Kosakonia sp. S42]
MLYYAQSRTVAMSMFFYQVRAMKKRLVGNNNVSALSLSMYHVLVPVFPINRITRYSLVTLLLSVCMNVSSFAGVIPPPAPTHVVMISCNCESAPIRREVIRAVERLGGTLLYEYTQMPGVAVSVPDSKAKVFLQKVLLVPSVIYVWQSGTVDLH